MNAYKKLIKNSGIFAIASLGSKLISIILVPFYTYVLSTKQYGTIDVLTTTVSLLIPIITLSIFDGTLRFSIKSEYNKENIFVSSIFVGLIGNLIFLIFYPILRCIPVIKEYLFTVYLVILLQSMNSIFSQFVRGIGKVKIFAANGVINTIITLISNIILLAKFNMGIEGYFISILVANIICNIYLIVTAKLYQFFSFKYIDKKLIKEMLIYSTPLIPNSMMWWIMNASDRYIISGFLGVAANGLYSVAYKIPTLLNLLNSIFFQAWQLSSVEESDSKDKSKFYSNTFNVFSIVMILGTSAILVVIKPVFKVFISQEYQMAWKYVPFLLLSVVFSSYASFLGTNYIAMKETKGVFKTSVIGAISNIGLNFLLVNKFGLNGTAFATMISYLLVWLLRMKDTKRFVEIKFSIKNMVLSIFLIFIQIYILYANIKYESIIESMLILLIILVNHNIISDLYYRVKTLLKNKKIKAVN